MKNVVANLTRDKVNTQEPPSIIPAATSVEPIVQTSIDTSFKVDTIVKVMMIENKTQTIEERKPTKEKMGQMDTCASIAKIQGAPQ